MRVNVEKTKIVIFRKNQTKKVGKWWYKGERLDLVEEFKYLGIHFQTNGTFKKHQKEMLRKAEIALGTVRKAIYKVKSFPVSQVLKIFDTMVMPILFYGIEVWGGRNQKRING